MASSPQTALQPALLPAAVYIETSAIDAVSFGPLEWLVIAIARRDSLTSIRRPSRLSVALGSLFGSASMASLADPRLESLRHAAVLAWHRETPTAEDLARFTAAGYGQEHRRLLRASVARDSDPSPAYPSAELH